MSCSFRQPAEVCLSPYGGFLVPPSLLWAQQVLALDMSPQMIRLARERSRQYGNFEFLVADTVLWEFPPQHFDCIVGEQQR